MSEKEVEQVKSKEEQKEEKYEEEEYDEDEEYEEDEEEYENENENGDQQNQDTNNQKPIRRKKRGVIPTAMKAPPKMPGQMDGTADHSGTIRISNSPKKGNPLERLKAFS